MGLMSLRAAVAEVGKHLFGDDWIGDELSAGALNIRARRDRDRDIASAIEERQIALLEEQEGRMAMLERAFSSDPEPLPVLSKDDLADVEKALAKKWEGEEEARKRARERLERATAWLRRRLYGTLPDYGDAVPSYIPLRSGKLWPLDVGYWNSHSVQEVLFTEVKYHPADYGQKFLRAADPLKGSVLIWQEGLREAITRDRAINQTDSGIDATASVVEGAADGSSSHSADNQRDRDSAGIIADDHLSRREQQKAKTEAKYERWYQTAREIKSGRKDDEPLSTKEIAKMVAKKEKAVTNTEVNTETIKRRLNDNYKRWAD